MNVGQGTTGTRFLDCVFSGLGFRTTHNEVTIKDDNTAFVDDFDYLSDNP